VTHQPVLVTRPQWGWLCILTDMSHSCARHVTCVLVDSSVPCLQSARSPSGYSVIIASDGSCLLRCHQPGLGPSGPPSHLVSITPGEGSRVVPHGNLCSHALSLPLQPVTEPHSNRGWQLCLVPRRKISKIAFFWGRGDTQENHCFSLCNRMIFQAHFLETSRPSDFTMIESCNDHPPV
jgi:hypothetical protein